MALRFNKSGKPDPRGQYDKHGCLKPPFAPYRRGPVKPCKDWEAVKAFKEQGKRQALIDRAARRGGRRAKSAVTNLMARKPVPASETRLLKGILGEIKELNKNLSKEILA